MNRDHFTTPTQGGGRTQYDYGHTDFAVFQHEEARKRRVADWWKATAVLVAIALWVGAARVAMYFIWGY